MVFLFFSLALLVSYGVRKWKKWVQQCWIPDLYNSCITSSSRLIYYYYYSYCILVPWIHSFVMVRKEILLFFFCFRLNMNFEWLKQSLIAKQRLHDFFWRESVAHMYVITYTHTVLLNKDVYKCALVDLQYVCLYTDQKNQGKTWITHWISNNKLLKLSLLMYIVNSLHL